MRFPGFIGPSYTLQSVNVDAQRCINLYPEKNEMGTGKEAEIMSLVGTPGLTLKATMAAGGPIRGIYTATDDLVYVVAYDKIYSLDSAYAATELGTLNTNSGNVSMADNGTSLVVVDGTYGYVVTLSSGAFAQIVDADFQAADKVVYLDSFFVFSKSDTGQVFSSEANSATSYDALDITDVEGSPDNVVSMITNNRQLWFLGKNSIEVYFFDSTSDSFPFTRIEGAFIEHGCAATWSVAKMQNDIYWLGRDEQGAGVVYRARGYQPERVSTHAVELAISGYADISTCTAWTYQENGHFFYVMNFDGADTSWVFDASTGLWHERAYNNDGVLERHRGNCHAYGFGVHLVGDYENGKIYQLSSSAYTDAGEYIVRRRRCPHLTGGLNRLFYHSMQLDLEVGVGLDGGSSVQGYDPQAILRFSDDGGHNWSNEKWSAFGQIGERKVRCIWRRLGNSRDRIFEVTITDPVKVTLIGAQLLVEPGGS